jgi:hypothetical protein
MQLENNFKSKKGKIDFILFHSQFFTLRVFNTLKKKELNILKRFVNYQFIEFSPQIEMDFDITKKYSIDVGTYSGSLSNKNFNFNYNTINDDFFQKESTKQAVDLNDMLGVLENIKNENKFYNHKILSQKYEQ